MNPEGMNGATYSGNKISEKEVRCFSPAISSRQSCLVAAIMSKKASSASVLSHMKRTLSCLDWAYVGRVTLSRASGSISRFEYSAVRDFWPL